jgi:hypothetical protein
VVTSAHGQAARHGYSVRTLSEQFNAKPAEIRRLLRSELAEEMRAAGLPL